MPFRRGPNSKCYNINILIINILEKVHVAIFFLLTMLILSCTDRVPLKVEVFETSASGNKLTKVTEFPEVGEKVDIQLLPGDTFQTITGIGGSFTEATAWLFYQLGPENRKKVLEAYFGDSGARYSLARTHINSCDFSLVNYSYAPVAGDLVLNHFTVDEDRKDIIPMIKEAMAISKDGFKIISSPWTAPPWMKDNKDWRGGKLLPEHYETWALFFSKYLAAYRAEGIDIWGVTVENEPLGNDSNWESMHFTPQEMNTFVKNHLVPRLRMDGHKVKVFGFDQNRDEEMIKWVDAMFGDTATADLYDGTAMHWYAGTRDYFPAILQYASEKSGGKHLINTEACIDAEIPQWKNDAWYWAQEATDWGWDWAPGERKHLHPKYVPVFRYARDIIGCLNNQVDGWIDWNMMLDRQGGPNWAKNWCVAPVIADPANDEVYFTPLYYTLVHFSRFIRPGAVRIGLQLSDSTLMATAVRNPDGNYAVVIFNPDNRKRGVRLTINGQSKEISIQARAIQTILITIGNPSSKRENPS